MLLSKSSRQLSRSRRVDLVRFAFAAVSSMVLRAGYTTASDAGCIELHVDSLITLPQNLNSDTLADDFEREFLQEKIVKIKSIQVKWSGSVQGTYKTPGWYKVTGHVSHLPDQMGHSESCFTTSVVVTDVDECKLNTHGCHSTTECQNTNGSYYCACKPGELSWIQGDHMWKLDGRSPKLDHPCSLQVDDAKCCETATPARKCHEEFKCSEPCRHSRCALDQGAKCEFRDPRLFRKEKSDLPASKDSSLPQATVQCKCDNTKNPPLHGTGRKCTGSQKQARVWRHNYEYEPIPCGCQPLVDDPCRSLDDNPCTRAEISNNRLECRTGKLSSYERECTDQVSGLNGAGQCCCKSGFSLKLLASNVICEDSSPPTLNLRGRRRMQVSQCERFVDPGIDIVDDNKEEYHRALTKNFDPPISMSCFDTPGEIKVTYTLNASFTRNPAPRVRTVNVNPVDVCERPLFGPYGLFANVTNGMCPSCGGHACVSTAKCTDGTTRDYKCQCPPGFSGDGFHAEPDRDASVRLVGQHWQWPPRTKNYQGGTGCYDTQPPVIRLRGDTNITVAICSCTHCSCNGAACHQNIIDLAQKVNNQVRLDQFCKKSPCMSVSDNHDKTITYKQITIGAAELTSDPGASTITYRVAYNANDSHGNKAKTVYRYFTYVGEPLADQVRDLKRELAELKKNRWKPLLLTAITGVVVLLGLTTHS